MVTMLMKNPEPTNWLKLNSLWEENEIHSIGIVCAASFSRSLFLLPEQHDGCRHRGMINFLPLFYVTHWKIRKQSPVLSFGIGSAGFFSLPVDARSQFFHTRLVSKAILGRHSRFIFVQLNLFVFFPFHIHHLNEMRRCQFQTHTHSHCSSLVTRII